MTTVCIFPDCLGHISSLKTARKKGTWKKVDGSVQQIWHCRECGGTWQTDSKGEIVQKKNKKKVGEIP